MKSELTRVQPVQESNLVPMEMELPGQPGAPNNPGLGKKLLRALRGRLHWAILAALLLGAGGSFVGYRVMPPEYTSAGLIEIKPVLPKILYENEHNSAIPMFDAYVNAQAQLMSSRRVIDMAMQSDRWKQTGRALNPDQVALFIENLQVQKARRGNTITVTFNDSEPDVAVAAVRSIIDAYERIHREQEAQEDTLVIRRLEERVTSLNREVEGIQTQIQAIADEYGSDGLEKNYQFKLEKLNEVESSLNHVRLELALAEADAMQYQQGEDQEPEEPEITAEMVARIDLEMEHYFKQRLELEDMRRMLLVQGTKPSHPEIGLLEKKIASTQEKIQQILKVYREKPEETAVLAPEELARKEALQRVKHIRSREAQLTKLFKDLQAETLELGRKALQIDRLKSQADMKRQRLKETRFRIEQLNVESGVSGRVNIISRGDEPLKPSKDKRRQLAIAGGVGGVFMGFGLVALLGSMDRRLRYIADAKHSAGELPILGILPRLPEDLSQSEEAHLAAGCVHHIRTMLQINLQRDTRASLCVTGPAQGSGKTSLTMSLGLSFVEAGMRTLLIDADLAGAGLTRRANVIVRRRLGRILREQGRISEDQLQAALARTGNGKGRLGEILLGQGAIDADDIAAALQVQDESQLGLVDAIAGMDLDDCVARTEYDDLYVLPIGRACLRDASRFSPARLGQLLTQAKTQFDIVIVDTGPVLGSVEASAIAASVDTTILTVARGDSRTGIDHAVEQLNLVQASIAGVVFNRASESDVVQSTFSSARSLAATSPRHEDTQGSNGSAGGSRRFGPLAHAVAQRPEEVDES